MSVTKELVAAVWVVTESDTPDIEVGSLNHSIHLDSVRNHMEKYGQGEILNDVTRLFKNIIQIQGELEEDEKTNPDKT